MVSAVYDQPDPNQLIDRMGPYVLPIERIVHFVFENLSLEAFSKNIENVTRMRKHTWSPPGQKIQVSNTILSCRLVLFLG